MEEQFWVGQLEFWRAERDVVALPEPSSRKPVVGAGPAPRRASSHPKAAAAGRSGELRPLGIKTLGAENSPDTADVLLQDSL